MKISVLTATFNRANLLKQLYNSLLENIDYGGDIEWLIMDDGSTDNTYEIVKKMKNDKIKIRYIKQENQGKMVAINKLVELATGNLIVDCDSDDYFTKDAFKNILREYKKIKDDDKIYALCFLKMDVNGNISGKRFKKNINTLFDLHFKEEDDGEKVFVFKSDIRKKFKHELENNEKFVTEARMYYKMDENYKLLCFNDPIVIIEYQNNGYTKNIKNQFINNPYGYYNFFKEILGRNMKNVSLKKRLYAIKHYILFSYLINKYDASEIKNLTNKLLYYILVIPGKIKSKKFSK